MRLVDADVLEKEGWKLHRTVRVDSHTMEYQVKQIAKVATAQPDWTPVSKRMPEERYGYSGTGLHYSDDFLVTILDIEAGESFLGMGYTCDGVWHLTSKQDYLTDEKIEQDMKYKVTAWAELPQPYVLTAEEREAMKKEEEE